MSCTLGVLSASRGKALALAAPKRRSASRLSALSQRIGGGKGGEGNGKDGNPAGGIPGAGNTAGEIGKGVGELSLTTLLCKGCPLKTRRFMDTSQNADWTCELLRMCSATAGRATAEALLRDHLSRFIHQFGPHTTTQQYSQRREGFCVHTRSPLPCRRRNVRACSLFCCFIDDAIWLVSVSRAETKNLKKFTGGTRCRVSVHLEWITNLLRRSRAFC